MGYTADKPRIARSSSELRATIHGWGVDLDPKNRPAVPKEHYNPQGTGAHWDFPDQQIPRYRRERSPEHKFLTPVFGTVCPPKALSGAIRRYAYRYSEGRTAHWVLLLCADRVDVLESRITALLRGRPDNPFEEAGLRSEIKRGGLRSRFGQRRADRKHQPLDFLVAAAPWMLAAGAVWALTRMATAERH
jgi:hypothetical protein